MLPQPGLSETPGKMCKPSLASVRHLCEPSCSMMLRLCSQFSTETEYDFSESLLKKTNKRHEIKTYRGKNGKR